MTKLRQLEKLAATKIQQAFRKYLQTERRAKNAASVATQTHLEACDPYHKMARDFYAQLGTRKDLMTALSRSMFESFALFQIAL